MIKRKNTKLIKPDMPITAALFTTLISYLLSEYCSRSFVVKLERFFDEVNEKLYEEDGDLEIYHRTVKRMMRLILEENVKDSDVILERLTSSPRDGEEIYEFLEQLLEEIGEEEMNSSLALFLENEFISRLNYVNVTPKAEQLRLILSKLENQDYDSYDEIINDLHTTSNEMNKAVIARSVAAVTLPDVIFGESDAFNSALRKVRNFMNDDKRIIRTGVKRLDKFLNGGWQAGRVYLANGISGGWKSGFLLNAALWTCRYNDEVVCNDRLKRPCVVYLSQENDIEETIERIISYVGGLDEKDKALPEDELAGLMRQFKLVGSRWELRILYRPKNAIATGDIDTMISEIESEGDVEVKFLVHDYIKRIKPNVVTGDIRIDLGEANLLPPSLVIMM